jgi:hypothetical protein
MRNIFLTIAALVLVIGLSAQGVFSNKTHSVLERVIQDYPNRFYNIKGELISQTHQTAEFKSTIQVPGSSSTVITRYTVLKSEDYTWSSTVFEAAGFEEAKNKFKEIYGQITNSIVTTADRKTFILSGQYEEPGEDKKITHVIFSLLPGVGEEKKLKVGLSLCQEAGGRWKITLCVYDQSGEEAQAAVAAKG